MAYDLDEFTLAQRLLDAGGLVMFCFAGLIAMVSAVAACRNWQARKQAAPAARIAAGSACVLLIGIAVTQTEGSNRITVNGDAVSIGYRFRPSVRVDLDRITGAERHTHRARQSYKRQFVSRALVIRTSDQTFVVSPLARTRRSDEQLNEACALILSRRRTIG